MLGVASQLSVATMESFASTFHMPVVIPSAVEPTSPPRTASGPTPQSPTTAAGEAYRRRPTAAAASDVRPYAIYVRPAYNDAIFALIRYFDWKHLYYLYDTEQGLRLSCLAVH